MGSCIGFVCSMRSRRRARDRGQKLFRISGGNGHCAVRSRIRSGVGNGCRRTCGSAGYVVGLWYPQSDQALVHARGGRMKPRVVFLCTSNSALSQIAEGWLRHVAGDRYDVCNAGTQPACLNPGSVEGWPRSGSTSHITDSSTPRSMRRSPSTM
jgi:hypothetical protein